jgi:hypothetical protein
MFKIEDLSEYTTYGKLKAQGCTVYRKSGAQYLFIVPEGQSHSDAWRAVMGPIR